MAKTKSVITKSFHAEVYEKICPTLDFTMSGTNRSFLLVGRDVRGATKNRMHILDINFGAAVGEREQKARASLRRMAQRHITLSSVTAES